MDVVAMGEEWENFAKKIIGLQSDFAHFKVDFLDRGSFRKFSQNLFSEVTGFHEIRITGYFSEAARETLEQIIDRPDFFVRARFDV